MRRFYPHHPPSRVQAPAFPNTRAGGEGEGDCPQIAGQSDPIGCPSIVSSPTWGGLRRGQDNAYPYFRLVGKAKTPEH